MYSMLEDLRIDLGIPSGKESTGAFGSGDASDDARHTMASTGDSDFKYNRDTIPSTLTHVTPLGKNTSSDTRNTNLNDFKDDDLQAFKPISSNEPQSDSVDHSVKSNTPAFSEALTHSRKSSYHNDKQEREYNFGTIDHSVKSNTPTLSDTNTTSRKNSHHSDLHIAENNHRHNEDNDDHASDALSDVTATSSRPSLGKTTSKFENTTHTQNDIEEEDGYDDVDTSRKSDYNNQDNKLEEKDDYDTKYDDDDYELETGRTQNDDDDYDTIRTNYEEFQSERSENDVYGQSEIESTKMMKSTNKSDDDN